MPCLSQLWSCCSCARQCKYVRSCSSGRCECAHGGMPADGQAVSDNEVVLWSRSHAPAHSTIRASGWSRPLAEPSVTLRSGEEEWGDADPVLWFDDSAQETLWIAAMLWNWEDDEKNLISYYVASLKKKKSLIWWSRLGYLEPRRQPAFTLVLRLDVRAQWVDKEGRREDPEENPSREGRREGGRGERFKDTRSPRRRRCMCLSPCVSPFQKEKERRQRRVEVALTHPSAVSHLPLSHCQTAQTPRPCASALNRYLMVQGG